MWRNRASGIPLLIRTSGIRGISLAPRCRVMSTEGGGQAQAPPPVTPPPPKEPPKETRSSGGFLKGLLVVGVGTAAGLVAAQQYYGEEAIRQKGNELLSWINQTVGREVVKPIKPVQEKSDKQFGSAFDRKPTPTPASVAEGKKEVKKEPAPVVMMSEPAKEPEVKEETPQERRKREKAEAELRAKQKKEEDAAENAALEVILEGLAETCGGRAEEAVQAWRRLIDQTKTHTDLLKKAMDDVEEELDKELQWQAVTAAFKEKEEILKEAEEVATLARENLEKLSRALEDGRQNAITKKNKAISSFQKSYNKLNTELNKMQSQVAKAESESRVMLKYKKILDKAKAQFREELQSIRPDVMLGDKKGSASEQELNASMLIHAHRRIEQLQKQIAQQIAMETQRVQQALDEKQMEDEMLADQRVDQERERLRNEFTLEKEKWDIEAQVRYEQELRRQKVQDAEAHSDHIQKVMVEMEKQMESRFKRLLHRKLLLERNDFRREIAEWLAKVRGIEAAVEGRAGSEKVARQAQELWLACVALHGVIREGREAETPEQQLQPLGPELDAIADAGSNHPYIQSVLKTLPEVAVNRGVWTEDNLKERFAKVRRVAKRVGMIDETGGTLFKYFLSYVQSFLIFNSVYAKSESDEVEMENLDTFQILNHANYWLQKGNLEQALRFMNQLTGESRRVASDWITEARLHLEVRQAAHALMAFASASGLGTIF